MDIPIYQIDAFTDAVFAGNPAAVCLLDDWLPDEVLQKIAAENNLAETAFLVREAAGYRLRWFTPVCEVQLCGHATLATAHMLFETGGLAADQVEFQTLSGELVVTRKNDFLEMTFPAYPAGPGTPPDGLLSAIGATPAETLVGRSHVLVFGSEDEVVAISPDMAALAAVDRIGTIVTAPGREVDFVSRFFAPYFGIPEDSVTGSTHCLLIPYWAERLGKTELVAHQISARGGTLHCCHDGDTVRIGGRAVTYMRGNITFERRRA